MITNWRRRIDTKNTANEIIPHLDADIGIDNYTGIDEKDTSVKDRKDFDEPLLNGEEWTLDDDEYFEEAKQKVPQSVDNSKKSSRWGWFF